LASLILKSLIKLSKQNVLLPFYHSVSDVQNDFSKHLYQPRTITQFKNDLDVFLKHYKPITLQELIQHNNGEHKQKSPCFHLTFDDGLHNFYNEVTPILIEKGISATVFLNTDFVDNKDLFYRYKASLLIDNYLNVNESQKKLYHRFIARQTLSKILKNNTVEQFLLNISYNKKSILNDLAKHVNFSFSDYLEQQKPYLTYQQIKSLQKQGFTFGAHSTNHPLYSELDLNTQILQTTQSLEWLKTNLNQKQNVFSFPFHDIGVLNAFFDNISSKTELTFGTSGLKKDVVSSNLQRLDMEKSSKSATVFLINSYIKFLIKGILGKQIIKRF
jgi:peptidoglycan/xylan/chitin deacetylase (PgdA/CDA1 family)